VIQEKIEPENNREPVRVVQTDLIRRSLNAVFEEYQDIPYSDDLKVKVREAVRRAAQRDK
jgi:hypothetical protein